MEKIKVVAFDFDDTLYIGADWTPWESFCYKSLRQTLNVSQKQLMALLKKFNIDTADFGGKQITMLYNALGKDINIWKKYRSEHFLETRKFNEISVADRQEIKKFSKKHTLYITSNSVPKDIEYVCETFGIDLDCFKSVLTNDYSISDLTKVPMYKKILSQEEISPDRLLVLGDNYKRDVLPAWNLGAKGLVVQPKDIVYEEISKKYSQIKKLGNIYKDQDNIDCAIR